MGGKVEDLPILVKNLLGAVAVMEIPVDDQDPLHPVPGQGMPGADGNVVKDAEPRRLRRLGVVARRPDQGKGVVRLPGNHAVDGVHDPAGREPCDIVSLGGGHRVGIEHVIVSPAVAAMESM